MLQGISRTTASELIRMQEVIWHKAMLEEEVARCSHRAVTELYLFKDPLLREMVQRGETRTVAPHQNHVGDRKSVV